MNLDSERSGRLPSDFSDITLDKTEVNFRSMVLRLGDITATEDDAIANSFCLIGFSAVKKITVGS